MNLSQLIEAASDGTAVVMLETPDGEPICYETGDKRQMSITLRSPDSDEARAAEREFQNMLLSKQKGFRKRKGGAPITAAQVEENSIRKLVALTASWDLSMDGSEPLKFSDETAFDLYEKAAFITEQLEEVLDDRAAFTKKRAKKSSSGHSKTDG